MRRGANFDAASMSWQNPEILKSRLPHAGSPTFNIQRMDIEGDHYVISGRLHYQINRALPLSTELGFKDANVEPRGALRTHFDSLMCRGGAGTRGIDCSVTNMRVPRALIDNEVERTVERIAQTNGAPPAQTATNDTPLVVPSSPPPPGTAPS